MIYSCTVNTNHSSAHIHQLIFSTMMNIVFLWYDNGTNALSISTPEHVKPLENYNFLLNYISWFMAVLKFLLKST